MSNFSSTIIGNAAGSKSIGKWDGEAITDQRFNANNQAIANSLAGISSPKVYVSPQQNINNSWQVTAVNFNHGLGKVPEYVAINMVCITADAGYSVGDTFTWNWAGNNRTVISKTTTQISCHILQLNALWAYDKTLTAARQLQSTFLNNTRWKFTITAIAF